MIKYVTGFMFSADRSKVALISKLRPSWQKGFLNGVGGKLEDGETPQIAMAREFREETSIETSPEQWKLFTILVRPGCYEVNFLFTFSDRISLVRSNEEEHVSVHDVLNLPRIVITNLRWLIPMALDPHLRFEKPVEICELRGE
jgi:8-oxo-dGTP diphosphatase